MPILFSLCLLMNSRTILTFLPRKLLKKFQVSFSTLWERMESSLCPELRQRDNKSGTNWPWVQLRTRAIWMSLDIICKSRNNSARRHKKWALICTKCKISSRRKAWLKPISNLWSNRWTTLTTEMYWELFNKPRCMVPSHRAFKIKLHKATSILIPTQLKLNNSHNICSSNHNNINKDENFES